MSCNKLALRGNYFPHGFLFIHLFIDLPFHYSDITNYSKCFNIATNVY